MATALAFYDTTSAAMPDLGRLQIQASFRGARSAISAVNP
jgi:hypothetical protein